VEVCAIYDERGAQAVQVSGVLGVVDVVLEEHLKRVQVPLGGHITYVFEMGQDKRFTKQLLKNRKV